MTRSRDHLPTGEFYSSSPTETFNLGHRVGARLEGGEILLLNGPLGAGKTLFVKGISSALGVDEEDVTSPSFTRGNPHDGRLRLYHIDLYRLSGPDELTNLGWDDILGSHALVLVEWPERAGPRMPDDAVPIELEHIPDDPTRRVLLAG